MQRRQVSTTQGPSRVSYHVLVVFCLLIITMGLGRMVGAYEQAGRRREEVSPVEHSLAERVHVHVAWKDDNAGVSHIQSLACLLAIPTSDQRGGLAQVLQAFGRVPLAALRPPAGREPHSKANAPRVCEYKSTFISKK
jgi:hypothetical protein